MVHLPPLIQDLGVILITAAVMTLLFKRLKQPVVLGYLIAGFLVGPHVPYLPDIVDKESVHVWAEIGVIFLLFGLGLEFSFKKLAKVGKSATLAATFEIVTMTGVGYLVGRALDWSVMDSLFLGFILSMSSTTIIIRAFDELGLKAKGFVSLVFGVLIVEDLAAILIMVLLTTIASPEQSSGMQIVFSVLRMGFFLLLWFVVGIYFVPVLLNRVRKLMADETMLVVSIGLCLMMVLLAVKAGFSPALGAFVMGSILAETREGKRIEHLILPVRDLFAAVFFVSVGMMINPTVLVEHFGVVILIIVVTIVGKLLGSGFGALLSGRSLKQSMQAGLSLAQIGEFSFLIAALGVSLKATSDFLYPIVIAVSAVTTFTTPYLIKFSDPVCTWIENHIPAALRERLLRYEAVMSGTSGKSGFSLIWKEFGAKVLLNSVVVIAISLMLSRFALPKAIEFFGDESWVTIVACLLALVLCVPFLRAIILGVSHKVDELSAVERDQLRTMQFGVLVLRIVIGIALVGVVVGQFANVQTLSGFILFALAAVVLLFSRFSEPYYRMMEKRFVANLNDREKQELAKSKPVLAPWDATLVEFVVSPFSPVVAKRLEESALRETTGATIAMIERGDRKIVAPDRKAVLLPYDRVSMIGTDEQLSKARDLLEVESPQTEEAEAVEFGLDDLTIEENSRFARKTIRECGLREAVNGLIVGIEREGRRIINPDSTFELKVGDRVWIVGDRSLIKVLRGQQSEVG